MKRFEDVERISLTYPRLQEHLRENKDDLGKVQKCLKEIRAEFSPSTIKMFSRFLDSAVNKLYDGINFESAGPLDFKDYVAQNNVVLVPNHQSHADYVAINYVVYKMYRFPLYVAGGVNLNIFPIGQLFKKCGCFFIRRSFARDIVYRLSFEAYLYYLLHEGLPIEFFFEGGRSRTGRLMPPKFGLYQMILESHRQLPEDKKRPLKFIPVSICHEYVPEHRSLAKELKGAKKKKENTGQLFKLFKLFSYQLGSVHIRLGRPVDASLLAERDDFKKATQDLAFSCFFEVGKNMMVTPSSVIAMILLDEGASGALLESDILSRAKKIVDYCQAHNVPTGQALSRGHFSDGIKHALELFVANNKLEKIQSGPHEAILYAFKTPARLETLYFKNTILHHFIVPWIIYMAWVKIFKGEIQDVKELKSFLVLQRNKMKFEFYLPSVKALLYETRRVIEHSTGKKMKSLDEYFGLSAKELFKLASSLSVFSRSFSYIFEGHYIVLWAIKTLAAKDNPDESEERSFTHDKLLKRVDEIYRRELRSGRGMIRFPEGNNRSNIDNALKYFQSVDLLGQKSGFYIVENMETLGELLAENRELISGGQDILSAQAKA